MSGLKKVHPKTIKLSKLTVTHLYCYAFLRQNVTWKNILNDKQWICYDGRQTKTYQCIIMGTNKDTEIDHYTWGRMRLVNSFLEFTEAIHTGCYTMETIKAMAANDLAFVLHSGLRTNTYTPLIYAARHGRTDVVKYLLRITVEDNEQHQEYKLSPDEQTKYYTPLIAAALNGHEDTVQCLLERGAHVNVGTCLCTPLTAAALNGHKGIVQCLLDHGALVNAEVGQYTPLTAAAFDGYENIVRLLLEHGANVNAKVWRYTPLTAAALNGHENIVRLLLEHGANVNAKVWRYTPLIAAALGGHEDTVRCLLENGAHVNTKTSHYTALLAATEQNHINVVRMLIAAGADVNKGMKKCTPLMAAVETENVELVRELLEAGADVRIQQDENLMAAVRQKQADMLRLLVEAGARFDGKKEKELNRSLLSAAIEHASVEKVKLLLTAGAEISDCPVLTMLNWDGSEEQAEAVRAAADFLLSAGADANCGNEWGTPLMLAVGNGDEECVKLLLAAGAELNPTGYASTPLVEAEKRGHTEIARLLVQAGAKPNAEDGAASLLGYIEQGNAAVVKQLLDDGAEANGSMGEPRPLMAAVEQQNMEIVETLIRHGADVNLKERCNTHQYPIIAAVACENVPLIKYLVAHDADVNVVKTPAANFPLEGGTALEVAASKGNEEIVELLLSLGAKIDKTNSYLMDCAVYGGNMNIVRRFFDAGLVVNADSRECFSPLHVAASKGDVEMTRFLLAAGAQINRVTDSPRRGSVDRTPLSEAIAEKHTAVVRLLRQSGALATKKAIEQYREFVGLIRRGVDKVRRGAYQIRRGAYKELTVQEIRKYLDDGVCPDPPTSWRYLNEESALMVAIKRRRMDLVKSLLRAGANPNWSNYYQSPLTLAARIGKRSLVRVLMDAGANVTNLRLADYSSPLVYAASGGRAGIVNLFLAAGDNAHAVRGKAYPLIEAARHGHTEVVQLLLDAGAQVNTVVYGECALGVAREGQHQKVEELLLRAGAIDCSCSVKDCISFLHAISNKEFDQVKKLLHEGAYVNAVAESSTPLICAVESRDAALVRLILNAGADVSIQVGRYSALEKADDMGCDLIGDILKQASQKLKSKKPGTHHQEEQG